VLCREIIRSFRRTSTKKVGGKNTLDGRQDNLRPRGSLNSEIEYNNGHPVQKLHAVTLSMNIDARQLSKRRIGWG